ncbi:MAG: hypothetical protein KY475_08715 [Planctomycetes bacterium]|nr:hypothetical protein [Planctomycetota bacterium]
MAAFAHRPPISLFVVADFLSAAAGRLGSFDGSAEDWESLDREFVEYLSDVR